MQVPKAYLSNADKNGGLDYTSGFLHSAKLSYAIMLISLTSIEALS